MTSLVQAIRDAWDTGDTVQIQRLLEERGSSAVAAKDSRGVSPLLEAARWGHAQTTLPLLLANGAKVNEPADDGRTALYVAAAVGHEATVRVLLAANAITDMCTTTTRWTPLHVAAGRGHCAVVRLLLANGAQANALSATGQTPRDLAHEKRHRPAVLLFDNLANDVLMLLSAQQRLAWALATQRRQPLKRTWTVAPDLIWTIGSLLASGASWLTGWSRTLARVGKQATKQRYDSGERGERESLSMSASNMAILAAEAARVERGARIGSFHRLERQPTRKGSE